jgi:hypothetical protein
MIEIGMGTRGGSDELHDFIQSFRAVMVCLGLGLRACVFAEARE